MMRSGDLMGHRVSAADTYEADYRPRPLLVQAIKRLAAAGEDCAVFHWQIAGKLLGPALRANDLNFITQSDNRVATIGWRIVSC
jgi:hypothetical protein